MSDLSLIKILEEVEDMTRLQKVQLIEKIDRQLQERSNPSPATNLADFFQNSPLVGIDIDLNRQSDIDNRQVNL